MSRLKLETGNWHRIFSSQFQISSFDPNCIQFRRSVNACLFFLSFIFSFAATNCAAEEHKWHAPLAESCFEMKITSWPTDPSAGIVAIVPDCGLLPKTQFKVEVFSEHGKPLKHEFLWHNPKEGLAVVFEPPGDENVFLYVFPSPGKMRFARLGGASDGDRASAFRPSLLLYVRNGNASLEKAHAIADKPPVGDDIYFTVVDSIFHSLSPVARDDNASSYYTGWFNAKKPGRTYFYTCSKDGSEFYIDGKLGYSWPGIHGRVQGNFAQQGQWINLSPGLHKIEYFHFNASFPGREAHLGWQRAGEQQVDDPKIKGKKNLDITGPMWPDDFIHSGRTELKRAFSKKGPLAIFNPVWESIIQPGKDPICLFRFAPFGSDNLPESAVCSWDFGNNRIVKGKSVCWLFGGYADRKVGLNISIGGYNSAATRSFFPKSPDPAREPPRVSVFMPEGRAQYRAAYQMMASAVPKEKRPCEDWNETMWEGFAAVLDQQAEISFLSAIVERSFPDLKRVPRELLWKTEDRIIEIARCAEPKKAFVWVEIFEKEEKDGKRSARWKAKKVELALYELNDVGLARVYAGQLVGRHIDQHSSALGLVRMGDVERFNNNFEAARQFYVKAQELYAGSNSPAKTPTKSLTVSRKPGEQTAETNAISSKKSGAAAPVKRLPVSRLDLLAQSVSDWKVVAVQEAGYYATVQDLIAQDAYEEARATLDQWELEFPTTKLTGDYLLAEAFYYIALNNYRAAVRILANYRRAVEISNELPRAMRMELYCLTKMQNDKEARAFARAIIERLPRHELADEMRNLLARNDPGPLIIDFDVHSREWTASEKVDASSLGRLFGDKATVIKVEPEENAGNE